MLGYWIKCCISIGVFTLLGVEGMTQVPIYKHYTVRDGIAHDIAYQIIQDRYGYIWIGTDDGLSKFNGSRFKNYSYQNGLKSNYVIDVSEAERGEFYIGTWGGGLHSLQNDTIFQLSLSGNMTGKISRVYQLENGVVYGKKNLNVFRQEKGSSVLEEYQLFVSDKTLEHVPVGERNYSDVSVTTGEILIDSVLYMFSSGTKIAKTQTIKGVYRYDGADFRLLKFEGIDDAYVTALWKENETFWLASGGQLLNYEGAKLIRRFDVGIRDEKIIQLQMHEGKAYFVTLDMAEGGRKIYSLDLTSGYLFDFSKRLSITSLVSDFLFDQEGALWITTYGQGVYYLPNTLNVFLGKEVFENSDLKEMDMLDDQLILLSPNSLFFLNDEIVERKVTVPYHSEAFQVDKAVKRVELVVSEERASSLGGINKDIHFINYKDFSFTSGDVKVCLTKNEVVVFKGDNIINEWKFDGLLKKAIRAGDKIYGVYDRKGIVVIDPFSGELLDIWNQKSGYFTDNFRDIVPCDGGFWCSTDVGLLFVSECDKRLYALEDGLISNHINSVFVDKYDVVWVASQKGLMVFVNDEFYLIDEQLGQKSTFITKVIEHQGWIYAIGNNGLFKLKNDHRFHPAQNTRLFVEQQESVFRLDYINYLNASSIKIDYRLNGERWVSARDEIIDFSNVKYGAYKIQFRYKDDLSNWSYTDKYFFELVAPWYQELWFYIFSISTVAGVIVVLIYMQLRRSLNKNKLIEVSIKEREQLQDDLNNVRHQIAQDFHDDLGNKLASISIISEMSLRKMNKDNSFYRDLRQIKKDSNELFHGMRDFVWSLDASHNQLFEVQLYLNDFGEQLFETSPINFKSYNNVSQLDYALPHYWNKQLVLTFKEAMTNVLKHSSATEVIFEVVHNNGELLVSLIDNGRGFDQESLRRVNGLTNMRERIKSIDGELIIETNQKGTKIIFKSKPLTT